MRRNGRERDFSQELSSEIDAWLRGDTSRRGALARLLGASALAAAPFLHSRGAAAAWRTAAPHYETLVRQAKADLASPDTPLGRAQAEAVHASTEGPKDGSAYRAVEAAKKFKGATLNMTYESGLQALEPRNFSGPLWQDLTGISSTVVELSHPDQYSKPIAEHIAQSGAYDILDIEPAWIPSLADGGVIAPIDDYVAKHMNQADLDDYHPLYKFLPTYKGKRWGFFDDGDVFALYYRRDVFEDPKLQAAYKAKFNQELRPPTSWPEYDRIAQFITDQLAPKIYGAAHFRKAGSPGNQFDFLQHFRANGGKFFDPTTMKAQLNTPIGIRTLQEMVAANKASMPGNNDLDAVGLWAAWLQGKVAMIYSWPPTGRMSENYAQRDKAINFVPASTIAGKVGYTLVPGNPEMASGYVKALAADFAECRGGVSVHAVDDVSGNLAGARDAAVHAAGSVPAVALHLAALPLAVAVGKGISRQSLELRERLGGGPGHAGGTGLRPHHRPHVHLRLGRRGPGSCTRAGKCGVGCGHREGRCGVAARGVRAIHEAAGLVCRPYDQDSRHGRHAELKDRGRSRVGRPRHICRWMPVCATCRLSRLRSHEAAGSPPGPTGTSTGCWWPRRFC